MKTKSKKIGSFNAKTHLARLIEEVQDGVEYVITKRGKPVAKLVKFKENSEALRIRDVIEDFDAIRNSVKGKADIGEYIREGRKY